MNIEIVITLIATIGGLSGLISAVSTIVFKALEYRKAQKGETLDAKLDAKIQPVLDELRNRQKENVELQEELREIRLDTTRTQLFILMEHQPHNHDTILKVAERYFLRLNGNWVAATEFMAWAKKEGIDVPPHLWKVVSNDKESLSYQKHK